MRRTVRVAVGAIVLLAASAAVAQTGSTATTEFYPLKKDTKWVYKVGETTITVKVSAVDPNGATLDTLVNDKTVATEVIKVDGTGVYRTKINKAEINPPVKILELKDGKPAAKGAKWKIESKIQDQPVKGEFSVKEDKEKVKVPAGEFEAVVVDGPEFEIAGTKTGVKYWFSANKGIVKLTYTIAGNDAVLELKEYTEGK
jgi:phage tail sheath protein FI